jgi:hypothetical protein
VRMVHCHKRTVAQLPVFDLGLSAHVCYIAVDFLPSDAANFFAFPHTMPGYSMNVVPEVG